MGLTPDIAIWIQGTTDGTIGLDPERYAADQKTLIAMTERASSDKAAMDWIIPLSTTCNTRGGSGDEIERALSSFGLREGDRFHVGPSISAYGPELRYDGCHLNPAGRDRLAQELAEMVLPILDARAAREDGEAPGVTPRA